MKLAIFPAVFLMLISTYTVLGADSDVRSFTPESVKEWVNEQDADSDSSLDVRGRKRLMSLVSPAANFRELAARDLGLAVQRHAVDGTQFNDYVESEATKALPSTWPYVFAGSVVFVGNVNSDRPIVAFYNPYIDAAVLTEWTATDEENTTPFVVQKMVAFVPSVFTSDAKPSQIVPWWLDGKDRGTPVSLKSQYTEFAQWFSQRWPLSAVQNPAPLPDGFDQNISNDVIEKRSAQALITMMALLHKSDLAGLRESLTQFRLTLREGSAKQLAEQIEHHKLSYPAALASLPPHFRENLLPVYVLPGESHCLVFLQVRHSPRFFYAIDFGEGNTPEVLSAVFLDFERNR